MTLLGSSFVLLYLPLLLLCYQSSVIAHSNETDRLALLEFKSRTHDPSGAMASWNNSIHFCNWNGVTCGHRHQRVTVLDLSLQKLAGSISPHIGNLSFLRNLFLHNNSFTGQIPPELGRLHRLRILSLSLNSLVKEIPTNLSGCINLSEVYLAHNDLSGRIPVEIGSLVNLRMLSLFSNDLTGNIPSSFGNLSALGELYLMSNHLGGRIPYSLGGLTSLKVFGLGDNSFEGTIPSSIFNLSSVETFGVYENRLHGSLPLELGTLLPNLQYFAIFTNQFTGIIPPSISNASNIRYILLATNNLTGQVPDLGNLPKLEMLGITSNSLGSGREGDLRFLSSLTNATNLTTLEINLNNFGGVLPHSLANLSSTTLIRLRIGYNQIGGSLPASIVNLRSLQVLMAQTNQLSGTIPEDIGKLQSLRYLQLDNNEFIGNIPSSIGNLGNLIILNLQANKLQGSIPSSLANCQSLWHLDMSRNNISGIIPPKIFTISSLSSVIYLYQNKLIGSLPLEVGNLKTLGAFDVSQNLLTGVIPSSIGSCISLEYLGMDQNFFHGTIPSSFASLRGLRYLNLSRSNMSGEIPDFLGRIPFEHLDLSFNNFSGSLPSQGIFKNATVVSVEGNSMLCGTTSGLHLSTCIPGDRKKKGMTMKLKIIIGIVFSTLAGFVVFLSLLFWLSKKKSMRAVPSSSEDLLLQVSYQTLFRATEGFSSTNLIGTGGFGSVYKGILSDPKRIVAIKVFHLQRRGASRSFMVECEALKNIRHRNLVKVITVCSSIDSCGDDFKAIVYEFMANGNLDEWLHPAAELDTTLESTRKLNLLQRLSIAIDIACALDYLHHEYGHTSIVHCDLKPNNILLDNEMIAQVGDFGLMKFLSESTNNFSISTTGVRGTIGYVAPEYGMGSEVSTYGDMYSYGVLLLEMFTARRPTDDVFNNDTNLHSYVKMVWPEQVARITDPILLQEAHDDAGSSGGYQKLMDSLTQIFGIAIECSGESPRERLNISDALAKLILVRNNLVQIKPGRHARVT